MFVCLLVLFFFFNAIRGFLIFCLLVPCLITNKKRIKNIDYVLAHFYLFIHFLFHFVVVVVVAVYSLAHCVLDSTANISSLVSLGESSGLGGDAEKEHGYLFTPPWSSICFPPYHLFVEQSGYNSVSKYTK